MDEPLWIDSILFGIIGAVLYVIIQRCLWDDRWYIYRRLMFGALIGYITFIFEIYIEGHIDLLSSFASSYVAIDILESIFSKYGMKENICSEG